MQGDHYLSAGFYGVPAKNSTELCHVTAGPGDNDAAVVAAYYFVENQEESSPFPPVSQYKPDGLAPWPNGTAEAWMCVAWKDSGFSINNTAAKCPTDNRGAAVQGWRVKQSSTLALCSAPPGEYCFCERCSRP